MVELVGEPGEVVADLFTHRDGDLLALPGLGQTAAHQEGGEERQQLHGETREWSSSAQLQFIVWLLLTGTD